MGYDRAITMFSPDGRLLQVEYAKKTVKQGSTIVGAVCKDGVVIVADKRIMDKLMVADEIEKVYQIDDHIGAAVSGLVSDGRILVERAQLKAQQYKATYDSPIDLIEVVKDVSDLKQICTQSGALRPFGVSLMLASVDEQGAKLCVTEPSGIYFFYKATAIGEAETEVIDILNKQYKETMSVDDGLQMCVQALKKTITGINAERIDAAFISTKDKAFKKLSKQRTKELMK
jgi:proteasome alpha subunit